MALSDINTSVDGSTYPGWKMSRFASQKLFWNVKNVKGYHPGQAMRSVADGASMTNIRNQTKFSSANSPKLWNSLPAAVSGNVTSPAVRREYKSFLKLRHFLLLTWKVFQTIGESGRELPVTSSNEIQRWDYLKYDQNQEPILWKHFKAKFYSTLKILPFISVTWPFFASLIVIFWHSVKIYAEISL